MKKAASEAKTKTIAEIEREETAIVVKLDAIGDFIMTYSSFLELHSHYKKLILICNKSTHELAEKLAKDYHLFDAVVPIDMKKYSDNRAYRKEISKTLRSLECDILLNMAYCRLITMEHIVSLISAKRKITLSRDTHSKKLHLCDRIYDEIVDEAINEFEICKDFHLLNAAFAHSQSVHSVLLNTAVDATEAVAPYLAILPQMSSLNVASLNLGEQYVIISSGGSYVAKKWPHYAEVANYILSTFPDCNVVLLGGPGDKAGNQAIYNAIREESRSHVKNLTAQYSLCDCIEIIRRSKAVIGNDTSYIHMAVMTGTKSVAVAGGWHWGRFLPYYLGLLVTTANKGKAVWLPKTVLYRMDCFNCNGESKQCSKIHRAGDGQYPCIEKVGIEAVIRVVNNILRGDRKSVV